jgi:hypothetical protein
MWAVDPLAGKFAPVSPWAYAVNNPLLFIDPTGMEPERNTLLNFRADWPGDWWERYMKAKSQRPHQGLGNYRGASADGSLRALPDDLYFTNDGQLSHVETTSDAFDRVFVDGDFKGYAQGQCSAAFNGEGWDFDGGLTGFQPSGNRWADCAQAMSLAGAGKVYEAGKWMRRNIGGAGLYAGVTLSFPGTVLGVNFTISAVSDGNDASFFTTINWVIGTPSSTPVSFNGGALLIVNKEPNDPFQLYRDYPGYGASLGVSKGIWGVGGFHSVSDEDYVKGHLWKGTNFYGLSFGVAQGSGWAASLQGGKTVPSLLRFPRGTFNR